jgi:hypothetical protein
MIDTTLRAAGHPLAVQLEYIERNNANFYSVEQIDLSSARTMDDPAYEIAGDTLAVASINGTARIVFNNQENARLSLNNTRSFQTPYSRFWIINDGQAGKSLTLNIGKDAAFLTDPVKSTKIADSAGNDINPLTNEALTPVAAVSIETTAVLADTDILATDYTPANTPCVIRTSVVLDTVGIFSAMITTGGTQRKAILNSNNGLAVDCLYTFDIPLHAGDTINFQTSAAGNVWIRAVELSGGVA